MTGDFRFAPNAARAARLEAAVRGGLSDSLKTLFDSFEPGDAVDPSRAEALFSRIALGPVPPAMFSAYVDLVLSLFQERPSDARALTIELLGDWPEADDGIQFVTLDDADLGPGRAERYRRLINDEAFSIGACSHDARRAAQDVLTAALDLLRLGAAEAHLELVALIRQIVLVANWSMPGQASFEGATTFSLWGAMTLNVAGLQDRVSAAIALAHETAHSLLFGFTRGERLTGNDDDERFSSPLRRDPRPMEGVAHATFVSARMRHVLGELLGSGQLDQAEAALARARADLALSAYQDGLATVLERGALTPAGEAVFAELRGFMDREAAAS